MEAEGKGPAPVLILGFDPLRSNWPWLHSFPIFFGNALGWLGSEARSEAEPRYRIGEVLTYRPEGRKPADPAFRDPDGRLHRVSPEKGGALAFAGASRPGFHHLVDGGEVLETFPVSLLSASESDVAPRQELRFGSQVVEAQASTIETRDIWKPFALAALLFLVLEWWVYNRRMHV